MQSRLRPAVASLASLALVVGASVVTVASPADASPTASPTAATAPTLVGGVGACTTTSGALVGVDYAHWSGPIVRGCDPKPSTGIALLTAAKFTTTGTQHDGPAFLCRIGNPKFRHGTQYPTPATESCVNTPPANAYWSFWLAKKGKNTWTYSPYGAYDDHPVNGEVEAWTFGATNIAGTTGKPSFTPNQLRAGLPAGTAPRAVTQRSAAGGTADLDAGTRYLVTNLTRGRYYEPFGGGFADFGLTMDGVLALAAAGTQDAAVGRIMNFFGTDGKDGAGRDVDDYTGIGTANVVGGALAKEALTVEVTGSNPRAFGHHNLITALDRAVCTAKSDSCVAAGAYRNSSSTFSQALGVLAQLRAGDTANAAKPVAFLLAQQRPSGAFPSILTTRGSETDSTAMAAMALALVDSAAARTAVAKALAWLAGQQGSDGGFPGASGDSVNSAALAAQALRLDARRYAAAIGDAESFLAGQQQPDGGFDVFAGDTNGSDVRASTQAVGGVVGTPFGTELDNLAARSAAGAGAAYLISRLTDGDHYVSSYTSGGQTFSYDDQGLTADGLFSLLADGRRGSTVTRIVSWLRGQVDAYADPSGAQGGPYSGAVAKLALVAESTGGDPTAFGGHDLIGLLTGHVCTAKTTDGSCTAKGDFASAYSTVSQALGVLALQAAPDASVHLTAGSAPVVRLHQLQCADGGFSSPLIAPGRTCTSDVDTTGYAVQALAAVPGTNRWLGRAQGFLQAAQGSDGRYTGAAGANSNSTALAAQGLQTLTAATTAPTPADSAPRIVAPIVAWQSALRALSGFAVTSGGFGLTTNTTADLRASTQAVAAAARGTLLGLSGAAIASTPRGSTTSTATLTTHSGPAAPRGSRPSTHAASPDAASSTGLAETGVAATGLVVFALLLLLSGTVFLALGRPDRPGRHHPAPGRG